MTSSIADITQFLVTFYVVLLGSFLLLWWGARTWYVRRHGHPRPERYASRAHRIGSFWFFVFFFSAIMTANYVPDRWADPIIIILIISYAAYGCWSVYAWKQASSNPDDYRYELLTLGGVVILLIGVAIFLPMFA